MPLNVYLQKYDFPTLTSVIAFQFQGLNANEI